MVGNKPAAAFAQRKATGNLAIGDIGNGAVEGVGPLIQIDINKTKFLWVAFTVKTEAKVFTDL